jgi:hypothetical protein
MDTQACKGNIQMAVEKLTKAIELFEALGRTDPDYTKPFRRTGFSGTAVSPMWFIKQMTQYFGTPGCDWGTTKPEFTTFVPVDDGCDPLVYCTIGVWVGSPDRTIYGTGGDILITKFKSGDRVSDDEAFKKAHTDAINNAFKYFGIAADVHGGKFDDNKYVNNVREELARENLPSWYGDFEEIRKALEVCADEKGMQAIMAKQATKDLLAKAEKEAPTYVQALRSAYAKRKKQLENEQ